MRLTASRSTRLGPPSRNGVLGEPDRETSPLAQGGIVFGPVLHPVPPLGDAVTASSIGLERHVEIRNQEGTAFLCHPDQGTNPPIRATQPRVIHVNATIGEHALKIVSLELVPKSGSGGEGFIRSPDRRC